MNWGSLQIHEIAGLLGLAVIAVSLIKMHRDPNNDFNILDTIMDNGRVSKIAFVFMGCWLALTFVFIGMYFQNKMTEALYMAYGTVCFAPIIARMFSTSTPLAQPPVTTPKE